MVLNTETVLGSATVYPQKTIKNISKNTVLHVILYVVIYVSSITHHTQKPWGVST